MSKITTLRVIQDPYMPPEHEETVKEVDDPDNYENLVEERRLMLEDEYGSGFINIQEATA